MQCPKCGYELQAYETDCPKCARLAALGKSVPGPAGTARAPKEERGPSISSRLAYWVFIFLVAGAAYFFTSPDCRPFYHSPNIIYRGTMPAAGGQILLVGVSIRSLNEAEATAQKIIDAETAGNKYAGVEVGFYTPFHIPTRKFGVNAAAIENDIKQGTAEMLFSKPAIGFMTPRAKGEPMKYAPPES